MAGTPPSGGAGEVVTLTWLIHDVQVWKVDRVHLGGKGAPWVETRSVFNEGSVRDVSASWHRANPKLRNLLDEVLSDAGPAAAAPSLAPEQPLVAEGVAATPARADAVQGWSSSAVAAWAGAGVLAGVVLTLVALRRRFRSEPTVPPDRVTATDQLAWP
jgi:hypothetical protein